MGGYGSGNHGGKSLVEGHLCLDVNRLHRTNRLIRWNGVISWKNNFGDKVGAVTLTSGVDRITASGKLNRKPWKQRFDITWTPCHFGRARPWFLCPYCFKRVAKLYIGKGGLGCRKCYHLAYSSTREDRSTRIWRKQKKLEAKIIVDDGQYFKPAGMHWKTFNRLVERIDDLEREKDYLTLIVFDLVQGW
jgi:hypothetical protein